MLTVQRLRMVSGGQLRRYFWPGSPRAARRTLNRLAELRVVERLERRRGGVRAGSEGFIYFLGPVGHRLLAETGFHGRRIQTPGDRFINHTLAVAEAVIGLREAEVSGAVEIIEVQGEPECWRPFLGMMGARVILKPDAFIRLGAGTVDEDRWFLEQDMATESPSTIASKIRRYGQHYRSGEEQKHAGVYPRVIWSVPDVRRAAVINGVIEREGSLARRLHLVTTHEALVPFLVSETRS